MAFLKIAFVVALACAYALGEPIFHKGDKIQKLYTTNTKINVTLNGKHLMNSEMNITVRRGDDSSPPTPKEVQQVYQLVNEHLESLQAVPQEHDAQANGPQCDVSTISQNTTVQSGDPKPGPITYLEVSKWECLSRPNDTQTEQH